MLATVVAPDVEAYLVGYLRGALSARPEPYAGDVTVGIRVPADDDPMPERLVVVRRDGGPRVNIALSIARLTIQVWAMNDADATDLALMVAALVGASPDGSTVVAATATGPGRLPAERGRSYRSLTGSLTVRGTQL